MEKIKVEIENLNNLENIYEKLKIRIKLSKKKEIKKNIIKRN